MYYPNSGCYTIGTKRKNTEYKTKWLLQYLLYLLCIDDLRCLFCFNLMKINVYFEKSDMAVVIITLFLFINHHHICRFAIGDISLPSN